MIIVYTGNGKGKTSACIGQAMRALGRDFAVGFGQFMKQPEKSTAKDRPRAPAGR